MIDDKKIIGNYAIDQYIGYGASSIVFRGFDLNCHAAGVLKRVAIKFVWYRDLALEELKRLEQTQGVFEICDLITYEQITGTRARELMGETLQNIEKAMGRPLPIEDEKMVGVLIMKLIDGEHLIDRTLYHGEALRSHEWTVDYQHPEKGECIVLKEWLTPPTLEMDLEQRLDVLRQLAKAIQESHQQGVVHGDLNPWNVFYQTRSGRISIIDLGRNNFGVQGWRAPEHEKLMTGEIESLPPETDVRLLGQWMRYLLPRKGPWSSLIHGCCQSDPQKRPVMADIVRQLKRFGVKRPRKRVFSLVAMAVGMVALAVYAWKTNIPFDLEMRGNNRVAVLPFGGSPVGKTVAEMVGSSLGSTRDFVLSRHANTTLAGKSILAGNLEASRLKAAELRQIGAALGAQFLLAGTVIESDSGHLTWTGVLVQQNGARRTIRATGQNPLILADSITSACLELVGSNEVPISASAYYSTNLNANFLFSFGNEFLDEGNINAAAPMFERAFDLDPNFHWAKAKHALCLYRSGGLDQSQRTLEAMIVHPEVLENPELLLACYEFLTHIARERGDYRLADYFASEGIAVGEAHGLSELMTRLISFQALILAEMGNENIAGDRLEKANLVAGGQMEPVSRIYQHLFGQLIATRSRDFEAARTHLDLAMAVSEKHGLESYQALILKYRGLLDIREDRVDLQTLEDLTRAKDLQERLGDHLNLLDTEYFLARYHFALDELDQAKVLTERLLLEARQSGVGKILTRAMLLLADIAYGKGEIQEARLYLHEALDVDNHASDETKEMVYSRLWKVYADEGEYLLATSYLRKRLEICERSNDFLGVSYAQNNMGELLERQGLFDRAMEQYELSLAYKREHNDTFGSAWTLRNMAMLLLKEGRVDEAGTILKELAVFDPQAMHTQLIQARYDYERGHFRTALDLMTSLRADASTKGAWNQRLEEVYVVMKDAFQRSRHLALPVLYGNN